MRKNVFKYALSEWRKYKTLKTVRDSIDIISELKYLNLGARDVVLVMLARNMSYYFDDLYRHYRDLGVTHFVYLDNGSTDESVAIALQWPNTVVARTFLNFRDYQTPMRQVAAQDFASPGWRVAIDPDELLDYSGVSNKSLPDFVADLDAMGITGVVAQMLDLVPEGPLQAELSLPFSEVIKSYKHYTVEDLVVYDYNSPDLPFAGLVGGNRSKSNKFPDWKYGGIRRTLFGEHCCLTKYPLFRYGKGVRPFVHPHFSAGLDIADFTILLKHYKFAGNVVEREARLISEKRLSHNEAELRAAKMSSGEVRFDSVPLNLFESAEELYNLSFLVRGRY